jgi:DsbC/DsbD-like thiol-disulfide interchange protein
MTRLIPHRRALPFLLTIVACAPVFAAPPPNPAHWSIEALPAKPLAPGARFTLTLASHIDPGWHIYAMEEPEGGPIATEIGLGADDPLTLLKVDEPPPQMVSDPVLHQSTGIFQGAADFTLHLQLPRKPLAHDAMLHVMVRYQSCSDKLCLPPHTETVNVPLASLVR